MQHATLALLFPIAGALLAALADAALKCTLLLLAAAAACLVLRRAAAAARHLVWLSALGAVLAVPVLELALPGWHVLPRWTAFGDEPPAAAPAPAKPGGTLPAARVADVANRTDAAPTDGARRRLAPVAPHVVAPPDGRSPTASPWRLTAGAILAAWGCGAALLLVPLARGAVALRRLARSARVLADGRLAGATAGVARELRIRPPRLLVGRPGTMPMVWGLFGGRLLLPCDAASWQPARLRSVLLHELAHLARRDPAALVIGQLARAVHWFNPLAWYALRRLRVERERACDDYVLRDGVKPSDYAQQVLELATTLHAAPCPASAALAMAQRLRIESRLRTILDAGHNRQAVSRRQLAALLLTACTMAGSLSLLRAADDPQPPRAARPAEREPAVAGDPLTPDDQPKPNNQQPDNPPVASKGPVVSGLDLSTAPANKHPKDLPDLYEPDPEHPGRFRSRKDVLPLPLRADAGIEEPKSAWIKYPVGKGRFYIEYRSDRRQPETERTYGPFQGDPFERFKLEENMTARLQKGYSPDDIFRIKLMLRTGDAGMARRAIRLMLAALGVEDMPIRLETYPASFRQVLEDYDATIERHASEQAAELRGALDIADGELERLTKEFPEDEYLHADKAAKKPPAKIPREAWGEAADGLRLAAVPDHDSLRPGQATTYSLVAENVGQRVIKFSVSDLLQSARAEVRRLDGGQVETQTGWFTGIAPIERFWLRPGEQMVLAQPIVGFVEKRDDAENAVGRTLAITGPIEKRGIYLVSFRIDISGGSSWRRDEQDGLMHRVMPAKGDWTGPLTSGAVAVAVSKH